MDEDIIEINGGTPLCGEVTVSGAKNAALPLLFASLLTEDVCEFSNIPKLRDVLITLELLKHFGGRFL